MTPAETLCAGLGSVGAPARDILIIGIGDILMGDGGAGIHVLNALEKHPALEGVTMLDGGTGGVNLLQPIANSPIVIVIDATRDGKPAGTVSVLRPTAVEELPPPLSERESGLKDLFAAAALLGRFPEVHLFTVSVEEIQPMTMALTAPVAAAVPEVARLVETLSVRLLSLKQDIPE
jgi:hydrogenase maturation protease